MVVYWFGPGRVTAPALVAVELFTCIAWQTLRLFFPY